MVISEHDIARMECSSEAPTAPPLTLNSQIKLFLSSQLINHYSRGSMQEANLLINNTAAANCLCSQHGHCQETK